MKIRPISDIHLEFGTFELPKMEGEKDQVLCILGDLNPVKCFHKALNGEKSTETFFDSLDSRFKDILYIAGNHEYYHGDVAKDDDKFKYYCDYFNVKFLQGDSIKIDDTTFIGATLWTDFDNQNPLVMNDVQRGMNDYNCIKDSAVEDPEALTWDGPKFTTQRALIKHYEHRKAIFEGIQIAKLNDPETKVVVMSHHAPHKNSIHEHYRSSGLNGAYYTNLEYEIQLNRPNLWLHGHVHNNFDYNIAETRVVCNPRGYHRYEENRDFDPKLVIEV